MQAYTQDVTAESDRDAPAAAATGERPALTPGGDVVADMRPYIGGTVGTLQNKVRKLRHRKK